MAKAVSRATKTITVPTELEGERLDRVISALCPEISRRRARKLILEGRVEVNRSLCKVQGRPIRAGTDIRVSEPPQAHQELYRDFEGPGLIYEDPDVLVFNKPPGMAVQPAKSDTLRDLVSWWEFTRGETLKVVHRLDVPASGVVILARHRTAAGYLSQQFKDHSPKRNYAARIEGNLETEIGDSLTIDAPLGKERGAAFVTEEGKAAVTRVRVDNRTPDYDDLHVQPDTGRFHQIRAHLAHLGHPILGDRRYGANPSSRLHLHAAGLSLELPNGASKTFETPAPWIAESSATDGNDTSLEDGSEQVP